MNSDMNSVIGAHGGDLSKKEVSPETKLKRSTTLTSLNAQVTDQTGEKGDIGDIFEKSDVSSLSSGSSRSIIVTEPPNDGTKGILSKILPKSWKINSSLASSIKKTEKSVAEERKTTINAILNHVNSDNIGRSMTKNKVKSFLNGHETGFAQGDDLKPKKYKIEHSLDGKYVIRVLGEKTGVGELSPPFRLNTNVGSEALAFHAVEELISELNRIGVSK